MTGEEQKTQKDSSLSQKGPAWENSNHPLYIHYSDQPGAILVAQPLMEDNFSSWIQSMNMALQIKNKIGFVDGTLTKPVKNPDEQLQWNRCNILIKTWLLASMSKEISKSFTHCKDARMVWLELYERFGQTNTVQLFHIENDIHDCTQGSSTVTSFFTQLKSLWDEKEALCNFPSCVCEAGEELKSYIETQKIMKFLMGLTYKFATVRSNIIGMDPLPTLNKVYSMALRHEKQAGVAANKSATEPSEAASFCAQRLDQAARKGATSEPFVAYSRKSTHGEANSEGTGRVCEKCGRNNHQTKNCKAHLRCSFCNFKGHTYDECRK